MSHSRCDGRFVQRFFGGKVFVADAGNDSIHVCNWLRH